MDQYKIIVKELELRLGDSSPLGTVVDDKSAVDLIRDWIGHCDREHVVCAHLNRQHELLSVTTIAIGSLSSAIIHPREVFKVAITQSASTIIVAHNHPSGDLTPSPEDLQVFKRLSDSGELLGIPLLDFLIVSRSGHNSFRSQGLLK